MKVELAELKARARSIEEARSLVREYLQARILECLQQAGAMVCVAFQGGTALRFLYSLPRFSEDLDFALEGPLDRYDLRGWLRRIGANLRAEGDTVEVRLDERRAVHAAWVRLPGLLHDAGLSIDKRQVLSVKVEVDTRPPVGAGLETTLIRRHRILRVLHHDRSSWRASSTPCCIAHTREAGTSTISYGI